MFPLKDDNPTTRRPYLTVTLIVVNVLVHFYQVAQGAAGATRFVAQFGMIPAELTSGIEMTPTAAFPPTLTIFTSMFLHAGFLHLAGNMLYLWIFGNNIEDRLGPVRFLAFYLLSGVFAVLLFTLTGPNSQVPLIGASGAVAGVLGAYVLHYPRARVLTLVFFGWFVRLVWIPAFLVLGIWFVMQLLFAWGSTGAGQEGGVAYMAHVGGFLFGMAGGWVFRRRF
ncbi:MAG TPA: rhomboid family intramembrane serine protease [Acidobacteriota bacterium]|nr:rhomboid family intramembrane serine protease [Acidobacteriota bacterium]